MSEFLPTLIPVLILAACSHYASGYQPNRMEYYRKEYLLYFCMTILLILFVGLRTHYNDTQTYLYTYENTDPNASLSSIDWILGNNPGYNIARILMRRFNVSSQSYLMIYAAVTVGISMWFLHKYTNNIWMSVFLFIMLGGYTSNMAAMKQCMAIALCLIGVDRAIQGKWISFALWVLLGSAFHAYALMYLLVPFLMFRPWSSKTYLLIAATLVIGTFLQSLMGTIIDITTMLGEEYDAATFAGEGVNPFRLAVVAVSFLLSFVARKQIAHENDRVNNLMMNLTMMNTLIMYIALFGTANYFARLANYFIIFHSISIPWLFTFFTKGSRRLLNTGAVAGYFGFFYYGNVINQPLDYYYAGITLREYLQSLF